MLLLRQFYFLFEESLSGCWRRSKHALTNGCCHSDCPGDVSPLGISVKVTFASLQNYNTDILLSCRTSYRDPGEGAGRGAWLSL